MTNTMKLTSQPFTTTNMVSTTTSMISTTQIMLTNTMKLTSQPFTTTNMLSTTTSMISTISTTLTNPCESGWSFNNNNCYINNLISLNNSDASAWCATNGATLMNVHNQDDLYFALSLNQGSFWVIILNLEKKC